MKHALCLFFILTGFTAIAQPGDSLVLDSSARVIREVRVDEMQPVKKYNPNIAVRRSAILPGWGQATNKKYWKIPIVYGALGTTGYLFFHNLNQYRDARDAYRLATDNDPSNDHLIKEPYYTVRNQPDRIRNFRNEVRQNVDYATLFFLVFWGLNVVDAAVDAHLKTFDVSDDLSIRIKAGYSEIAGTNGIGIAFQIQPSKFKK